MPATSAPVNGDIVVRQETREGKIVYALHTAPGPDQYLLHTREHAVSQALTFAKCAQTRAWFATGEADFMLLGEFHIPNRQADGVPAGVVRGSPNGAVSREPAMNLIQSMVTRLRAEYSEMPGLRLKPEQVQRLCGIDPRVSQSVLDALI